MITKISIENYKSITKLDFSPGRFNILIGENGGGKSNLLEAISYGVAASLDKLDKEFLGLRGIRVTEPQFMVSAFEEKEDKNVCIFFESDDFTKDVRVMIDPQTHIGFSATSEVDPDLPENNNINIRLSLDTDAFIKGHLTEEFFNTLKDQLQKSGLIKGLVQDNRWIEGVVSRDVKIGESLKTFVFYCPEESALRTFRDDYQLLPLGRKGEGLFKYLKDLSRTPEGRSMLWEISNNLCLLDWFDHIEVPEVDLSKDYTVHVKDRYVADTLSFFDQRSTNEGFLYLLFYFTLFISKDTPSFFAIDNIESSFNPKLCTKVIETLQKLAVKHNKQVILTTHNPFILDGLDLSDDDQRLFVVRRNDEGHTKVKRVEYKPERKKKLSELWMSGAIGGLPDNF